ncbi:class IV adenylate cyclase [Methanococcoides methylutens]|uniref:Adenylate cyclase n=1 Tax=Methanococcoides methylutens MM1 TaxID=1434104 RepID=A0A0E3SQF0_METMT|nr:class IV adenylate cyclase [Methanococcoides methylutens]AKB84212.1 Adenylate cyclase [Methanococcoides methylutens MM1]
MIEIEIKVRADHAPVLDRILEMGALKVRTEDHLDVYYNAPHRDFAKTDEALRLRSVNGGTRMTYKGRKLDSVSKTREEFETPVDGTAAKGILVSLGFFESGIVKKTRDIYSYGDLTICFDSVDGLGEFVEVETVADSDVDLHRERLFDFLESIGIKKEDSIRTSYLEMLMEK